MRDPVYRLLLSESDVTQLWSLRPGVTYLNHGSFGPPPISVREARQEWMNRLDSEPMDFFVRQLEEHLDLARERLAAFIKARAAHLVFVENATVGMNIVARSFPLANGDQIVATNHEYGAVQRIWRKRCHEVGAEFVVARLPDLLGSTAELVETLFAAVTGRTKLIVVSHVTSPTAVILPVREICVRARELGIAVCIDGPHAPAAVDIEIERLGCDFYTASCHKWLSAPFGSGFLYVHPRWQASLRPAVVSWGQSLSGRSPSWLDEFNWSGTRDPSAFLTIPAAIDFFEADESSECATDPIAAPPGSRLAQFREHGHSLARHARQKIVALTGLEPLVPENPLWYGTMIALPLPESVGEPPEGHMHPVQKALWEQHQIEVPITNWGGRRFVRVSCHLYNDIADIDRLVAALEVELDRLSRAAKAR